MSETLNLARQFIREASVSPEDGNCQQIMDDYLVALGFEVEHMPFGPVKNLWASRRGSSDGPMFVFAGHTDVVPPGPLDAWDLPPFSAEVSGDILHGRGAADMKGSLAAMLTAVRRFLDTSGGYAGTLAFLVTSDEEAAAVDGTVRVMDTLDARNIHPDYCLIGEPSSDRTLGDVIRVGRRGSLNGRLVVSGIQGHVAYPQQARNPIHEVAPALAALTGTAWDSGNRYFPATSLQVSNIHGGTGANNVIPGEVTVDLNFRFSTESTEADLRQRTESIVGQFCPDYRIDWSLSGPPFLTEGGALIAAVQTSIRDLLGIDTELSTAGGTSDGRFIAPRGVEVVELGPRNATIHKINEEVSITEIEQLSLVYEAILNRLLKP